MNVILWDFDGTLAHRPGLWGVCEKPHLEAFALARRAVGGAERIWMVGDSYDADVGGGEAVGIPAVLARTSDPRARRCVRTLDEFDALLA